MPWEPLPGTSSAPRRIGAALDGVLRRAGGMAGPHFTSIVGRWPDLMGPELAAIARPVRLHHGALVLAVDDPAVASDLRWRHRELAALVNGALGTEVVNRVDVVVRPPS